MTGKQRGPKVVALLWAGAYLAIIWFSYRPQDARYIRPGLWRVTMRTSQGLASIFGRLALRAEHSYRKEVQP